MLAWLLGWRTRCRGTVCLCFGSSSRWRLLKLAVSGLGAGEFSGLIAWRLRRQRSRQSSVTAAACKNNVRHAPQS